MEYLPMAITAAVGLYTFRKFVNFALACPAYDYKLLKFIVRIFSAAAKYEKARFTHIDRLFEISKENGDKPYILFEDEVWTYSDVNKKSNQIARALKRLDIKEDVVSLFMTSQPLYVAAFFGAAKTGRTSALINNSLRKEGLLHCIEISNSQHVIISNDDDIITAIEEVWEEVKSRDLNIYVLGESKHPFACNLISLSKIADEEDDSNTPSQWKENVELKDNFFLIYTSGTTGLPKAVNMTYKRCWLMSFISSHYTVGENDIFYCPLPLYHTNGSLIAVMGTLNLGGTVVIRKKFSASRFWDDVHKFDATVIQYVGEILTYVCRQPPRDNDRDHRVRIALGNGLRVTTWKEFIERFGDIKVGEYYGATEGLGGFFNSSFKFGAIGQLSPLLKFVTHTVFAKYDHDKNEIVRDANGRVVQVSQGEPGLLLTRLKGKATAEYVGYHGQKEATMKKIVKNVVKNDDEYFNSGDIILWHTNYDVSFVDRIGDTFRWKGENVSTKEVENIFMKCFSQQIEQNNVYGVEISGCPGRCGMMSISMQPGEKLDLECFLDVAKEHLPTYAHPLFLRIVEKHMLTGTWKLKKVAAASEGYDLDKVGEDEVYFLHPAERKYIRLTRSIMEDIDTGKIKL